ncbi:hypothetical protein AB0D30_21810 [Streptomyces sp. NPDC048409]|uniref:hypothetical protein n=1 Tax=Streptomyces sp. NPDC048409 TaxID=3154723 RepID=UPI003413C571
MTAEQLSSAGLADRVAQLSVRTAARARAAHGREFASLLTPQDRPHPRTMTRITPAPRRLIAGGTAPRDRGVKHPDHARSSRP